MKTAELFEANGAEKAAVKLGTQGGKAGKPALSKDQVQKAFGGHYAEYIKAYEKAKQERKNAEDHEAWREKRAAALQGRHYHEGLDEAVAPPFEKFKKGQRVKVKKTGKEVTVLSQDDIGLVYTAADDATRVDPKQKVVQARGYQEYMPSELELVK
jgi:hypothetical protein